MIIFNPDIAAVENAIYTMWPDAWEIMSEIYFSVMDATLRFDDLSSEACNQIEGYEE